jgi:hypothetical protein
MREQMSIADYVKYRRGGRLMPSDPTLIRCLQALRKQPSTITVCGYTAHVHAIAESADLLRRDLGLGGQVISRVVSLQALFCRDRGQYRRQ